MTDDETKKQSRGFFSAPTRRIGGADERTRRIENSGERTVAMEQENARTKREAQPSSGKPSVDGATRLAGPRRGAEGRSAPAADEATDFVVGWLVIVKGPGKGRSLSLGYGLNSIGRGGDQRVRLDFGDVGVSRSTHCSIAYDQRSRKFFIQHGGGQNLTYLRDQPVLAPTELPARAEISVGDTVLVFMPLCGSDFEWSEIPTDDGDRNNA